MLDLQPEERARFIETTEGEVVERHGPFVRVDADGAVFDLRNPHLRVEVIHPMPNWPAGQLIQVGQHFMQRAADGNWLCSITECGHDEAQVRSLWESGQVQEVVFEAVTQPIDRRKE